MREKLLREIRIAGKLNNAKWHSDHSVRDLAHFSFRCYVESLSIESVLFLESPSQLFANQFK